MSVDSRETAIELDGLSKSWDGGRTYAVRDITLQIHAGEVVALLGGSGSGKSTIIKMINRLMEPTRGTVRIFGEDVQQLNPFQLRRQIGYVFQAIGLFPHLSVAENVGIGLRIAQKSKDEIEARVEQLMALVHLPLTGFGDRYPHQLSGGQQQRVGFARALAAEARVMLLDEPFGALDPVTRDSLQREFQTLQSTLAFTAVLVTHDMAEALLLADRIAVLHHGELIRLGTPAELLREPGHEYVAALIETPQRHADYLNGLLSQSSPDRSDGSRS